ncbi:hypothetical protein DYB36_000405 [Aphanomyces astaci]|uniref:Uncharacterized protein n=1 Tax=Aphanomyces astaci TaxID=112090 RepID=A0A397AKE6_APHAT|nr:hypothetical protein DYB36_000405 [Aphanomyces astaci]
MDTSDAPRAARGPSTGRPAFKNWPKKLPKQHKNTVSDYREHKAAIDHYELHGMSRYDIDVIYNADQTAVKSEYLPTKTLNKKGENTVWVKCGGKTKDRMTDMLLADNTGTKHTLFLVIRTPKSKIKVVIQENLTMQQGFGKRLWESAEPCKIRTVL